MVVNSGISNQINEKLSESFEEMVDWRRHMHQHPELSFQEEKTAHYIQEKLISFGLQVKTHIGGFGLIGILEGEKPGKTVALRADFDALPIQDEKEAPYKSQNSGVMHACGHDGHTAALLGTAKALSEFRQHLKGTVVFLFQPAEETPPGELSPWWRMAFWKELTTYSALTWIRRLQLAQYRSDQDIKWRQSINFRFVFKAKAGTGPDHMTQ